jgi:diacylglycerol kinase family enzyme
MTAPIAFIINAHAGHGIDETLLEPHGAEIEALAAGGTISLVRDDTEIDKAVTQALAQGCRAIVAGGGDGTLNAVAARIVGSQTSFGVLPLGTFNHFAKDLGIPLDVEGALRTIASGHTTRIDVAEVNGQHFLNNSSLGLYVDIVRRRDRQQSRLGRGKCSAFLWALWSTLRRYPFMTVELDIDGQTWRHRTPFVFVGNNAYLMNGLQIGTRKTLQAGVLSVYVAERAGRSRLFQLGMRALFGRLRPTRDFRELLAKELTIETHHAELRVSTDGELVRLRAPLRYCLHPGALSVLVPKPG